MIPEDEEDYAVSLVNLCNSVLESVISVFEQFGVGLPERRYVTVGQTVHDCEQVTVSFQQLYLGPPGDQAQTPQKCTAPRTAFLNVEIVRSLALPGRTGKPSADAMQTNAETKLVDAYLLLKAGADAVDQWGIGVIADVTVGEASGDRQAVILNVTLAVP